MCSRGMQQNVLLIVSSYVLRSHGTYGTIQKQLKASLATYLPHFCMSRPFRVHPRCSCLIKCQLDRCSVSRSPYAQPHITMLCVRIAYTLTHQLMKLSNAIGWSLVLHKPFRQPLLSTSQRSSCGFVGRHLAVHLKCPVAIHLCPLPYSLSLVRCEARQSDSAFVASLCSASLKYYKSEKDRATALSPMLRSYLGFTVEPTVVAYKEGKESTKLDCAVVSKSRCRVAQPRACGWKIELRRDLNTT